MNSKTAYNLNYILFSMYAFNVTVALFLSKE